MTNDGRALRGEDRVSDSPLNAHSEEEAAKPDATEHGGREVVEKTEAREAEGYNCARVPGRRRQRKRGIEPRRNRRTFSTTGSERV